MFVRLAVFAVVSLGVFAVSSRDASATLVGASGASCVWPHGSSAPYSSVGLYEGGVVNFDTLHMLEMFCPISMSNASLQPTLVEVYYNDKSTTNTLSCHAFAQDAYGNGYVSVTRASCSIGGGCSPGTSSYVGAGVLFVPIITGSWVSYHLTCEIPPKDGTSFSSITGLAYY